MKKLISILLALLLLPSLTLAWGGHKHHGTNHSDRFGNGRTPKGEQHSPVPTPAPSPAPAPSPVPVPTPIPAPTSGSSIGLENVYLTGYGDLDNTPPGSPVVDLDGHHGVAGGDCTYNNPTTLAVGHVITNGNDKGDFAYGTKFYVPKLQCYFVAQDSCGDGQTPQNKACHTPEEGSLQLDLYTGHSATEFCESQMTAIYSVIQNPIAGLPIKSGDICTGNTLNR